MTTIQRFFLTLTLAAATALPLYAYNETINHRQMTIVATEKSALYTDPSIMFALGLNPAQRQQFIYHGRLGNVPSGTELFTTSAFIAEGAIEEDAGWRAQHHFYDPVNNRSIAVTAWRSWEWMLEESPISGQDRSLRDARDFLTRAMTFNEGMAAEAEQERIFALTSMLLSLGHVMHHLQDMAQPQHVRHDQHVETWWTGALGASNPSRFEYYTAERTGVVAAQSERAVPIFPGSSDFRSARDFWFNAAGTGIAQWVNRDFVSQSSNFIGTDTNVTTSRFAQPKPGASTDYTIEELYAQSGMAVPVRIQNLCGSPSDICKMRMYSTPVSQRASTLSIFDQDMRGGVLFVDEDSFSYTISRAFELNRFNFDDAHEELIKRAVSYSAGFVNHFFRGKLQITPPASGPYAVVDHSTNEGFKTIQATVTNATEEQRLPAGKIRAIAKFRRNLCYQPDLTGEFKVIAGQVFAPPCPKIRSDESYVRVSAEQSVFFDVGESKAMTFTFSDPIPLDATDLILQVYYTGTVGDEQESFALGAVDVSEPTFTALMNATDTFAVSGTFYYWPEIINRIAEDRFSIIDRDGDDHYNPPTDVPVEGLDLQFAIFVNGELIGGASPVPQGRFARIATIVDPEAGLQLRLETMGSTISHRFSARFFQLYDDVGWRITAATPLRDQTLQFNSTTLIRYYPELPANIDSMPISKAVDYAILVPVQITPGRLFGAVPSNEWTRSMDVFRAVGTNTLAQMLPKQVSNLAGWPQSAAETLTTLPGEPAGPTLLRPIEARPRSLPPVK
jgi:hypothetical protein